MKISDLPAPVTASKSDWLSGDSWLGFTPSSNTTNGRAKCQSTIQRQFGDGYVLEYITETFGKPNPGFERHPIYLSDKTKHRDVAGRLIAVHRLRTSARPLEQIVGRDGFSAIQDMWDQAGDRTRWSVAFPIIESYTINGWPKARDVFVGNSYFRIYQHSSSTLRPLQEDERRLLADLQITPADTLNAWIGIEDEFEAAEASDISQESRATIDEDLPDEALEGMTNERRSKLRKRAAWIADRFVRERRANNQLLCDHCRFDPSSLINVKALRARSLLDVHHKNPLLEGTRYTTTKDFALLCPICHRLEHQLLTKKGSLFRMDALTRDLLAIDGLD